MKKMKNKIFSCLSLLLIFLITLGLYYLWEKWSENERVVLKANIKNQEKFIKNLAQGYLMQKEELRLSQRISTLLQENLGEEKEAYGNLQNRFVDIKKNVGKITKSVDIIKKVQNTDPELLEKYSKVYFLNEHYFPKDLQDIEEKYKEEKNRNLQIMTQVWDFLEDLLEEAEEESINLRIISAYRSFYTQADLKRRYIYLYGQTAADNFSADQGKSEHQLGTTVDFTTLELSSNFDAFKNSSAYTWLSENAYKYGFVLSYPDHNPYYEFEPWHWRFVGKKLAKDLHKDGKYFYDTPQREINEYTQYLFDK